MDAVSSHVQLFKLRQGVFIDEFVDETMGLISKLVDDAIGHISELFDNGNVGTNFCFSLVGMSFGEMDGVEESLELVLNIDFLLVAESLAIRKGVLINKLVELFINLFKIVKGSVQIVLNTIGLSWGVNLDGVKSLFEI